MNEPPRGQRPASENEIRETELKLGSYSYREDEATHSEWQTRWRQPKPAFVLTHVRLVGGEGHEHISELQWTGGVDTLGTMVDVIRKGGDVRIVSPGRVVKVGVVETDPPHIRAYEVRYSVAGIRRYVTRLRGSSVEVHAVWTDDLLRLPRF